MYSNNHNALIKNLIWKDDEHVLSTFSDCFWSNEQDAVAHVAPDGVGVAVTDSEQMSFTEM